MRFFLILSMLVITSCTYDELLVGCMDSLALNYDSLANIDDGSCVFCVYGCMDSTAINYYLNF